MIVAGRESPRRRARFIPAANFGERCIRISKSALAEGYGGEPSGARYADRRAGRRTKTSLEAYAPDESAAIMQLAQSVGTAIDVLSPMQRHITPASA